MISLGTEPRTGSLPAHEAPGRGTGSALCSVPLPVPRYMLPGTACCQAWRSAALRQPDVALSADAGPRLRRRGSVFTSLSCNFPWRAAGTPGWWAASSDRWPAWGTAPRDYCAMVNVSETHACVAVRICLPDRGSPDRCSDGAWSRCCR